jgi:hypothetical protein
MVVGILGLVVWGMDASLALSMTMGSVGYGVVGVNAYFRGAFGGGRANPPACGHPLCKGGLTARSNTTNRTQRR